MDILKIVAVLTGSFLLGAAAIVQGLVHQVADKAPDSLLMLAPWSSKAPARKAELLLVNGDAKSEPARRYAKSALSRDPTNVIALRTLAMIAEIEGEELKAQQLLAQAQKLSRRDLTTQLLAVRTKLQSGNDVGAMEDYSAALLTSRKSWSLFLPLLSQASADITFVPRIAQILAMEPQWLYPFYQEWLRDPPQPESMIALSRAMDAKGKPLNLTTRRALMGRLIEAQRWDLVRAEYGRLRPALSKVRFLPIDSFESGGVLMPLDWSLNTAGKADVRFSTTPQSNAKMRILATIEGFANDEVARRLLLLVPGDYQLTTSYTISRDSERQFKENEGVKISLQCYSGEGLVFGIPLLQPGSFSARFRVGNECGAQWIFIGVSSRKSGFVDVEISPPQIIRKN